MTARDPVRASDATDAERQRADEVARAFHDFEQSGWRAAAAAYQSALARLTALAAPALLDAALVAPGSRLLDLASGPGDLAALAHARGARVTGTDFADAMLALARARHPGVEFQAADAEDLPFEPDSFDAVTMSFLVGHLARPEAAISGARRVLVRGGRVAFSWWQRPDRAVAFGFVMDAVRTHGRMDVAIPQGPPFDRYSEPAACEQLLAEAGLVTPRVETCDMTWSVASGEEVFDVFLHGTVRSAALLRGQMPEALRAIRAEVVGRVEALRQGGTIAIPMPCWIASAAKP